VVYKRGSIEEKEEEEKERMKDKEITQSVCTLTPDSCFSAI